MYLKLEPLKVKRWTSNKRAIHKALAKIEFEPFEQKLDLLIYLFNTTLSFIYLFISSQTNAAELQFLSFFAGIKRSKHYEWENLIWQYKQRWNYIWRIYSRALYNTSYKIIKRLKSSIPRLGKEMQ